MKTIKKMKEIAEKKEKGYVKCFVCKGYFKLDNINIIDGEIYAYVCDDCK